MSLMYKFASGTLCKSAALHLRNLVQTSEVCASQAAVELRNGCLFDHACRPRCAVVDDFVCHLIASCVSGILTSYVCFNTLVFQLHLSHDVILIYKACFPLSCLASIVQCCKHELLAADRPGADMS